VSGNVTVTSTSADGSTSTTTDVSSYTESGTDGYTYNDTGTDTTNADGSHTIVDLSTETDHVTDQAAWHDASSFTQSGPSGSETMTSQDNGSASVSGTESWTNVNGVVTYQSYTLDESSTDSSTSHTVGTSGTSSFSDNATSSTTDSRHETGSGTTGTYTEDVASATNDGRTTTAPDGSTTTSDTASATDTPTSGTLALPGTNGATNPLGGVIQYVPPPWATLGIGTGQPQEQARKDARKGALAELFGKFKGAVGQLVANIKTELGPKLDKAYRQLKLKGIEFTGVLTGDIFDKASFNLFKDLKPGENQVLITINGIRTKSAEALKMRDSIQTWDIPARNRAAVQNGTHGLGAGDVLQILLDELGRMDLTALRAAQQIEIAAQALRNNKVKVPVITVVAHSQGTMIFLRALKFLSKDTIGMIEFYGNGGETFVPDDIGLRRAVNFYRPNDPVPAVNNWLPPRLLEAKGHKYVVHNLGATNGWPLDFKAHSWDKNYDMLYKYLGQISRPDGSKLISYPPWYLK
jgi:hypothetical protein